MTSTLGRGSRFAFSAAVVIAVLATEHICTRVRKEIEALRAFPFAAFAAHPERRLLPKIRH